MSLYDVGREDYPSSKRSEQYSPPAKICEKHAILVESEDALANLRTVSFLTMLKAIIMKEQVAEANASLSWEALDSEHHGRAQIQALIQASVSFCNGKGLDKLKGNLTTMLNCGSESRRYLPFAMNPDVMNLDKKVAKALVRLDGDLTNYAADDVAILKGKASAKVDNCSLDFDWLHRMAGTDATDLALRDMSAVAIAHADGRLVLKQTGPGSERTGTKPFMALPLMEHREDDTVKRTLRHELESFIWTFAWVLEGETSEERWSWDHPSFRRAAQNKRTYWSTCLRRKIHPQSIRPSDKNFWESLCTLRARWDNLLLQGDLYGHTASPSLTEFMAIFEKEFPRGDVDKSWDWVSFDVAAV